MIRSAKATVTVLYIISRFCAAIPAGQSSLEIRTSSQASPETSSIVPITITSSASLAGPTYSVGNATLEIAGLVRSQCLSNGITVQAPCVAVCPANRTDCLRAASAEVQTCSPLWQDYLASAFSASRGQNLGSAWTTSLTTVTPTVTGTETIYTTFSPASDAFTVGLGYGVSKPITYTPVYALGDPAVSTYTSIDTTNVYTLTEIMGPSPTCKFTRVTSDVPPSTNCGQCTLVGGTVELFYWPTATNNYTNQHSNTAIAAVTPLLTVLHGTTLHSPSAYISFQTAYATDSCSRVGMAHTGAIIGLPPSEISTLVHWGGKAAASGANQYGPINYADLTGLPPASVYESQQSCLIAGCRTIYPSLQPTLVVPSQMRALDDAWRDCGLGLEGLYDPPVALTPQAVMASPTTPASYASSTAVAASVSATMPVSTRSLSATSSTSTRISLIVASSSESDFDSKTSVSTNAIENSSADPVKQSSGTEPTSGTSWPSSFSYQPASTTESSAHTRDQSSGTASSHMGGTVAQGTSSAGQTTQIPQTSTIPTTSTTNALSILVSALSSTGSEFSAGMQTSSVSSTSVPHAPVQTTNAVSLPTTITTQGAPSPSPEDPQQSNPITSSSSATAVSSVSQKVPTSVSTTTPGHGTHTSPGSTSQISLFSSSDSQTTGKNAGSDSSSIFAGTTQRSSSLPAIVMASSASGTATIDKSSSSGSAARHGSATTISSVEGSAVSGRSGMVNMDVVDCWHFFLIVAVLTAFLGG